MGLCTQPLIWLPKRIEEKSFEVWKGCSLVKSSVMSVLSRMLIWLYRPIYLFSVHFSRFDMLTPNTTHTRYHQIWRLTHVMVKKSRCESILIRFTFGVVEIKQIS